MLKGPSPENVIFVKVRLQLYRAHRGGHLSSLHLVKSSEGRVVSSHSSWAAVVLVAVSTHWVTAMASPPPHEAEHRELATCTQSCRSNLQHGGGISRLFSLQRRLFSCVPKQATNAILWLKNRPPMLFCGKKYVTNAV